MTLNGWYLPTAHNTMPLPNSTSSRLTLGLMVAAALTVIYGSVEFAQGAHSIVLIMPVLFLLSTVLLAFWQHDLIAVDES